MKVLNWWNLLIESMEIGLKKYIYFIYVIYLCLDLQERIIIFYYKLKNI